MVSSLSSILWFLPCHSLAFNSTLYAATTVTLDTSDCYMLCLKCLHHACPLPTACVRHCCTAFKNSPSGHITYIVAPATGCLPREALVMTLYFSSADTFLLTFRGLAHANSPASWILRWGSDHITMTMFYQITLYVYLNPSSNYKSQEDI